MLVDTMARRSARLSGRSRNISNSDVDDSVVELARDTKKVVMYQGGDNASEMVDSHIESVLSDDSDELDFVEVTPSDNPDVMRDKQVDVDTLKPANKLSQMKNMYNGGGGTGGITTKPDFSHFSYPRSPRRSKLVDADKVNEKYPVNEGASSSRTPHDDDIMAMLRSEENVAPSIYTPTVINTKSGKARRESKRKSVANRKRDGNECNAGEFSLEDNEEMMSDSEDEDWEEVRDHASPPKKGKMDNLPEEMSSGITITLDPAALRRSTRNRKTLDQQAVFQKMLRKFRTERRINIHKVNLLCLLSHGLYVNEVVNSGLLLGLGLSVLPSDFHPKKTKSKVDLPQLTSLLTWYRSNFVLSPTPTSWSKNTLSQMFSVCIETRECEQPEHYVLIFVSILRCMKLDARFILSLQPAPLKNIKVVAQKSKGKKKDTGEKQKVKRPEKKSSSKNNDGMKTSSVTSRKGERTSMRRRSQVNYNEKSEGVEEGTDKNIEDDGDDDNDDDDSDRDSNSHKCDIDSLSSRSSSPADNSVGGPSCGGIDWWAEVWSEDEKRYVCVDVVGGRVDKTGEVERAATTPVCYVLAYGVAGRVKDVTSKYASQWLTKTRKMRVDEEWWEDTLYPYILRRSNIRERAEDDAVRAQLAQAPVPASISELKGHPLYVLKRHLLKFECIYPADAPPLAFIRDEPVYARECVHTLHSRETWLKEARSIKAGEEPYKMVRARPRKNQTEAERRRAKETPTLPVFGLWQTEPYQPPVARDGKVPRNDYNNVDLFQPSMLPIGTVHLLHPGLGRVARKLNIDYAVAMLGWDTGRGGWSIPIHQGIVVCEEFEDVLLDAWKEEQVISKQKEVEKREKEIYERWKTLIKGVLIRERLRLKYGTLSPSEEHASKQTTKCIGTTKRNRKDGQKERVEEEAASFPNNQESLEHALPPQYF